MTVIKVNLIAFCKSILESQRQGALTEYCLEHWDSVLELFGDDPFIIDTLQDKAAKAVMEIETRGTKELKDYWQYVKELKEQFES